MKPAQPLLDAISRSHGGTLCRHCTGRTWHRNHQFAELGPSHYAALNAYSCASTRSKPEMGAGLDAKDKPVFKIICLFGYSRWSAGLCSIKCTARLAISRFEKAPGPQRSNSSTGSAESNVAGQSCSDGPSDVDAAQRPEPQRPEYCSAVSAGIPAKLGKFNAPSYQRVCAAT